MDIIKNNKIFSLNTRVGLAEREFLEKEVRRIRRKTKQHITISDVMRGLIQEKMAKKP